MHYYSVLEAANLLIDQRGWKLMRCRRRIDGPPRYIVFDESDRPLFVLPSLRRNFGYTLRDILMRLCADPEIALSTSAQKLLQRLDSEE